MNAQRGIGLPEQPTYSAGYPSPASATYEQVNLFGSPTGIKVRVSRGEPLANTPIGHGWVVVAEHPEG
jgi:hypothetical protein